jgi:sarcosine oxidase subunit gamma
VFVLSGADALTVLSHGCSIDLERVPVGGCVQGGLAQTQVAIARVSEDVWRVYPRASFARHLAAWLHDAALEYVHR